MLSLSLTGILPGIYVTWRNSEEKWERKRHEGKKENARKKEKIVSQRILREIPLRKEKKICTLDSNSVSP